MMHWEPFRALRDLDRLSSQLLSGTRTPLTMPMDVWREGQTYHVALDLPGVEPGSIDVQLERNTLTVTGQRRAEYERGASAGVGEPAKAQTSEQETQVLVAERPQGSFTRQLALGEGLDASAVQADYRNGVLYLTIPVAQQAQARRIQISQSSGGGQPQVSESGADSGTGEASGS